MIRRHVWLVVAALLLVVACTKQGATPPIRRGITMADSAEQVMLGVRMLLTDRGVQRGELFADTGYVFDEQTRFELRKVRATFNTSTGTKDGVLSADRGTYSQREEKLEGFGNVVIVTTEGKRLTSPQMRYMKVTNEVSSDSAFTLVEPGRTAKGVGFRADPQLTRIQVLRNVGGQGSFTLPGK
ncbi:MAG: LPS export ABC transporter periplasmic protein LptC [Gemmatimonadaceae bacterium]